MRQHLIGLVLLLTIVGALPACAQFSGRPSHYSAEPIEARVVDVATKQPLEGVIVTANWELRGPATAGGSAPIGQLMVLETVTGKDGKFAFPAWGPERAHGALLNRDPQLLLFKPGYRYRGLENEFRDGMELESIRRSEWHGKTIEMKLFKGAGEEYAEHVYDLGRDIDRMLDFARGDKECNWKKVPRMLVALDRMGLHFESQGVKLKAWRLGQHVLRIEDIPVNPRCGSPKEFLRSYLP